jgi:pSer/pThr/pTyr-binding forkhead associated (FHA) protein
VLPNIEQPARLILCSEGNDAIEEFLLDKQEIVIGRAPTSDILLSKDKLTSRRHAYVCYEQGKYTLIDQHSANGTFVNGEQIEEAVPYVLHDGDRVGIGEHELIFRAYGSGVVEDLPTVSVNFQQAAEDYETRKDELATLPSSNEYETYLMPPEEEAQIPAPVSAQVEPTARVAPPVPQPGSGQRDEGKSADYASAALLAMAQMEKTPAVMPSISATPAQDDGNMTFNRLMNVSQPALPDMGALMAALSTLDGQVMALQEQFNATGEAFRSRDTQMAAVANQLRTGILRVAERMDMTIADVARSREALAWAELLQLMEDVMTNPRDIEYVIKLARKARELNKVFQLHQNVLNTMAECNSLLRSMIGDGK